MMDTMARELSSFLFVWNFWHEKALNDFKNISSSAKSNLEAEVENETAYKLMQDGDLVKSEFYYKKALVLAEYQGIVFGQVLYNFAQLKILQRKYSDSIALLDQCLKTTHGQNNYIDVNSKKMKACGLLGRKSEQRAIYNNLVGLVSCNKFKEDVLEEAKSYLSSQPDGDAYTDEELIAPACPTGIAIISPNILFKRFRITAKNTIKKGEVVLVESPQTCAGFDYCVNCRQKCVIYVPCQSCCNTLYCSEDCRDNDIKYHTIECGFYRSGVDSVNDVKTVMALRLFVSNLENQFSFKSQQVELADLDNCFDRILNMLSFSEKYYRSGFLMKDVSVGSVILTAYIITTLKHFKNLHEAIGLLFMRVIISVQHKMFLSGPNIDETNTLVYVNYSMLNHSCSPNTIKYLSGSKMVLKAAEDIEKGKEIYISYGSVNCLMPSHKRRELLQKFYNFDCRCHLCLDSSERIFRNIIKCPHCEEYASFKGEKLVCQTCKYSSVIPLEDFIYIKRIYELVKNYQINYDLADLKKALNLGEKIKMNRSNSIISTAYFQLGQHEVTNGSFKKCLEYIQGIKVDQYNYIYYVKIIVLLEKRIKGLFLSGNSPYQTTEGCGKKDFKKYMAFLNELTVIVQMYYPKKSLLETIVKVEKFYTILKQITDFENSVNWRKPAVN